MQARRGRARPERRRRFRIAWVALALWTIVAAAPPALRAETHLQLAVSGLSEAKLALYVAEAEGFFEQAGLSTEILEFRSGGEAVKAFVGGGVDFCVCAADHAIVLQNRNYDVKLLVGLDAHYPNALIAPGDSPITDLASLKGRKLGVTSPGSSTDNLLRWALTKGGLDPDLDVEIVSIGTGAAMRAAVDNGAVDAGVLQNAEIINAELRGRPLRVVIDWRTTDAAALNVIGRQEWIDENPRLAEGFVAAVLRATKLLQADPAVARSGTKKIFPEADDAFIDAVTASALPRLSPDGTISRAAFDNTLDIVRFADPSLEPVAFEAVYALPRLASTP